MRAGRALGRQKVVEARAETTSVGVVLQQLWAGPSDWMRGVGTWRGCRGLRDCICPNHHCWVVGTPGRLKWAGRQPA